MPGFNINGTGGDIFEGGAYGKAEAKRKYRWLFKLLKGGEGDIIKSFLYLVSAKRPAWDFQPLVQHHNQEQISHIGKTQWTDIDLKWYDMEQPLDCCDAIYKWIESTTYNMEQANPMKPTDYKQITGLDILDNLGAPIESWKMYNSWPTKVDTDSLDYSGNDLLYITCTLKYDRAQKIKG